MTTEVSYKESHGPKNEFQSARVNEQSVFKPQKFYCIYCKHSHISTIAVTDSMTFSLWQIPLT